MVTGDTTRSLVVRTTSHAMNVSSLGTPNEGDDTEGERVLRSLAHRKTGRIPIDLVVRHVIAVTTDGDWPVRRAAMEALLRRFDFAARDRLRVASRPAAGKLLGIYKTRRMARGGRPYRSLLASIEPLRGSCDCTDFLRGSLGVCKHLLTVLQDVAARDRGLQRAVKEKAPCQGAAATIAWDPIRPLTGLGDWLDRIEIRDGHDGSPALRRLARRGLRRHRNGARVFKAGCAEEPSRRLALVRELLSLAERGGRSGTLPDVVPEPAVLALLEAERTRLELVTANRAELARLHGALSTLERRLYPYQIEGVERFFGSGRLLLADDMGLGKTAQAIAVCHALFAVGKVERGLVVVPASLKPQWLREWQLFTNSPIGVVEGPPDDRRRAYRSLRRGFLIVNYEQALRDLDLMHALEPEIVVLDEAQRIKNWATRTAAAVKTLKPRYRLVLTGTPMENRLEELASLLDFLDDPALEPKWRLAPWHSQTADGKREVIGAKELGTLRTRLSSGMLRRSRAEVLKQLPPRTDTRVPVAITDAQRDEHDAFNQPIARLVSIASQRPLTQAEFLKLMQMLTIQRVIANGLAQYRFEKVWEGISRVRRPDETLLQSLSSPKLLELRQIVTQVAIEQERKIVVFSQWRRMLRLADWAIADLLADAGLRAVFFTGEERSRQRTRNLIDFHDDPSARLLFATDAGGVGLNLQHAASGCVNLELPWNPAVLEQRIGRIYRLGQKRPIDVWNLITQASIEERILGLVEGKRALFNGLFDGESEELRFDRSGSFIGQLVKIVEPMPATASAREAEADAALDEATEAELERAIDAGDGVESAPPERTLEITTAAPRPEDSVERESTAVSARQVEALFAGVRVSTRPDRGVVIEADPAAASVLISLFQGMAGLLSAAKQGAAAVT